MDYLPRIEVTGPALRRVPFGLLDAVETPTSPDATPPRWEGGIQHRRPEWDLDIRSWDETCGATRQTKTLNRLRAAATFETATAFVLYSGLEASSILDDDTPDELADYFDRAKSRAAEEWFLPNVLNESPAVVSGGAEDLDEAIAQLTYAADSDDNHVDPGTIHIPRWMYPYLRSDLYEIRDGGLWTKLGGARIVLGQGYRITTGRIYMTGTLLGYQSAVMKVGPNQDTDLNDTEVFVEQSFVIAHSWESVVAVNVDLEAGS